MVVIRPNDGKPEAATSWRFWKTAAASSGAEQRAGCMPSTTLPAGRQCSQKCELGCRVLAWGDSDVRALAEDADGGLWIGVTDGTLYRRLPDGHVERYASPEGPVRGYSSSG